MLVQFSKQYEMGSPFNTGAGGGTADYAFCVLLGMAMMLLSYPFVVSFFSLPPVFCKNLIVSLYHMSLTKKQCLRHEQHLNMSLSFSLHFPLVLCSLRLE
jgi:hypothetical protein